MTTMPKHENPRPQMLKLYEAVDAYQQALDWIEENEEAIREAGGEIPPELDWLLNLAEGDLTEKVKRTALVIQNLKANAEAAKSQADRIAAHARSYARQAEVLTNYLQFEMERAGVPRVETPVIKVRIQRASRPSIRPVGEIPEAFQRVRVDFDAQAAYEHLRPLLGKDSPDSGEVDGLHFEYSHSPRIW